MPPLRVATRSSALARWQAERVVELLGVEAEYVIVSTRGDERRDVPIHAMGGTGVFVKEVEQAVLDDRADLAVHSAKDLPSTTADDARSKIVATLAQGSVVTTPRFCIDCVVTEYGVARLRGKTLWQRAEALIAIAHPKFRDELANSL